MKNKEKKETEDKKENNEHIEDKKEIQEVENKEKEEKKEDSENKINKNVIQEVKISNQMPYEEAKNFSGYLEKRFKKTMFYQKRFFSNCRWKNIDI